MRIRLMSLPKKDRTIQEIPKICFKEEKDERLYPHLSVIERNRLFNTNYKFFFYYKILFRAKLNREVIFCRYKYSK